MAKVWDVLKKFKRFCKRHGWKTCESDDWVEIDSNYHNFLWTRSIHLSSFKRLISNRKCVIREGVSYHVVEPSCTAWVFSEAPSEELIRTVFENQTLSSRIALYDLSPFLKGKNRCTKVNNTESPVFQEFENFLENKLKVKVEPFRLLLDSKTSVDGFTVPQLA